MSATSSKVVALRKQSPPLNVPGTVTRVGWVAPKQMSVEEWLSYGLAFHLVEGAAQWWKGDWWIEGERRKYGDGEELAARVGVNYDRIRVLGSVARAYELLSRNNNLTFKHHLIAMAAPDKKDRLRWLKRAEENGWTTAQLSKEITDWKRGISRKSLQLTASAAGLATLLYADPPWQYSNSGFAGAAEEHFPTMSTDEICEMNDAEKCRAKGGVSIGEIVADEAVLFMWATNPMLEDALRVIKEWGFTYKSNAVWIKDRQTYGKLGFYFFSQHELLLVATKGAFLPDGEIQSSVIEAKKAEHSRKPLEAYDVIEKTYPSAIPTARELFCRGAGRKGWMEPFGNQAESSFLERNKAKAASAS